MLSGDDIPRFVYTSVLLYTFRVYPVISDKLNGELFLRQTRCDEGEYPLVLTEEQPEVWRKKQLSLGVLTITVDLRARLCRRSNIDPIRFARNCLREGGFMDKQRFEDAIELAKNARRGTAGIGTLSEKTLHMVIKRYISPFEDEHEIKIGTYVADIVNEEGIIEIQTQGFDKLRKKLEAFLSVSPVTVVYPIAHTKYLTWVDPESGEVGKERKSPKKGSFYDAFSELYRIKPLLCHQNLCLKLLLIDLDEYRFLNKHKGKRYGTERIDRIPRELVSEFHIGSTRDYAGLIPDLMPEKFCSEDFKTHSGLTLQGAQTALNVLSYVSAISCCGKKGRRKLYERLWYVLPED